MCHRNRRYGNERYDKTYRYEKVEKYLLLLPVYLLADWLGDLTLIQKVIKYIHHYNAIGHSMRWYVICCDNNFCKRVVC